MKLHIKLIVSTCLAVSVSAVTVLAGAGLTRAADSHTDAVVDATTYPVVADRPGDLDTVLAKTDSTPASRAVRSFEVRENSSDQTVVGTVADARLPQDRKVKYKIISGNTGNAFAIDVDTGEISVVAREVLDFERMPRFVLVVKTTTTKVVRNRMSERFRKHLAKSGLKAVTKQKTTTHSTQQSIVVNVTDEAESPYLSDQTFSVVADTDKASSVGQVSASDPDADESVQYSITEGNANGRFEIDADTGAITLKAASVSSAKRHSQFELTVRATDRAGLFDTAKVVVDVDASASFVAASAPTVASDDQTKTDGESDAVSEPALVVQSPSREASDPFGSVEDKSTETATDSSIAQSENTPQNTVVDTGNVVSENGDSVSRPTATTLAESIPANASSTASSTKVSAGHSTEATAGNSFFVGYAGAGLFAVVLFLGLKWRDRASRRHLEEECERLHFLVAEMESGGNRSDAEVAEGESHEQLTNEQTREWEDVREELEQQRQQLDVEKTELEEVRAQLQQERESLDVERNAFDAEKAQWETDRAQWLAAAAGNQGQLGELAGADESSHS